MAIYWMGGHAAFRTPLKLALTRLHSEKATLFLSTVSLQEILVYSRSKGTQDLDHAFLAERFTFLPFDERCALEAARLGAQVGSPNSPAVRKKARPTAQTIDLWYRDAAIAGTAEAGGMDVLITADAGLRRDFGPLLKAEVRLVEPSQASPPSPPPAPSAPQE